MFKCIIVGDFSGLGSTRPLGPPPPIVVSHTPRVSGRLPNATDATSSRGARRQLITWAFMAKYFVAVSDLPDVTGECSFLSFVTVLRCDSDGWVQGFPGVLHVNRRWWNNHFCKWKTHTFCDSYTSVWSVVLQKLRFDDWQCLLQSPPLS